MAQLKLLRMGLGLTDDHLPASDGSGRGANWKSVAVAFDAAVFVVGACAFAYFMAEALRSALRKSASAMPPSPPKKAKEEDASKKPTKADTKIATAGTLLNVHRSLLL